MGSKKTRSLTTLAFVLLLSSWPQPRATGDSTETRDSGLTFEQRVDKAVARGREALRKRLHDLRANPRKDFPMGRLALPLAAVLKAGLSADDMEVLNSFEALSRLEPDKTYSVACYIFALDALWNPGGRSAHVHDRQRRSADAEGATLERAAELTKWLIEARFQGRGTWTYDRASKGKRHDFSNTQFAVLALHFAQRNGLVVPLEVFEEVVQSLTRAQRREAEPWLLMLSPPASFAARLGVEPSPRPRTYRVLPGGWGYRHGKTNSKPPSDAEEKGRAEGPRGKTFGNAPYPSMTAAGASCLAVALKAFSAQGRRSDRRLLATCRQSLLSSHAWISKYFDSFLSDDKNLAYTLYSLEKAGDLSDVERFGNRDWYRSGAQALIERQRRDGTFGSYIDTSFALLFLTRASRQLDLSGSPTILTGSEANSEAADSDRVFLAAAGGFVSARQVLRYIGKERQSNLVRVAEEVVKNYAPHAVHELVPLLLELWGPSDRISRWARAKLSRITGIKKPKQQDVREWQRQCASLVALEGAEQINAKLVLESLRRLRYVPLKIRCLAMAQRQGLRDLLPALLVELDHPSIPYRRAVHDLLRLWTDAEVKAPRSDDETAWKATTQAWLRWWGNQQNRRDEPPS